LASPRILGVCGSLRAGSHNLRLLEVAARLLAVEAQFELFAGLKSVPPFDEDDEAEEPVPVARWRSAIEWADGALIATPEYNSSIPGQLKNAIDWASRPVGTAALRGKNVAVVGASTGMFGAVWSQAETRKALAAAGARVLGRELAVPAAHEQFGPDGDLLEPELQIGLRELLAELLREVRTSIELRGVPSLGSGGALR
jgi:chromate reductase